MHVNQMITFYCLAVELLAKYPDLYLFCWQMYKLIFIFQILVRMNFITVLLCIVLDKPYQLYYFSPLISFWYLVQTFILEIPNPSKVRAFFILQKVGFYTSKDHEKSFLFFYVGPLKEDIFSGHFLSPVF